MSALDSRDFAIMARVRLWAVLFGIFLLAVTGYWTFAYFRRRWRR
jgi:hypothetical protein